MKSSLSFLISMRRTPYFCLLHRRNTSVLAKRIDLAGDILGCSGDEVSTYCSKVFSSLTDEEFVNRLTFLKNFNLNDPKLSERLLLMSLHPLTVKNRYHSLLEYGCQQESISSRFLNKYLTFIKKKIHVLRKSQLIPRDCNIAENLSKVLSCQVEYFDRLNDNSTALNYKLEAINYILTHHVGYTADSKNDLNELFYRRMLHKSLNNILNSLNALKEIGFSLERIRNNNFLIHCVDYDNVVEILSIPNIGGTETKKVLYSYPKILASPAENVHKIISHIKEFKIPDESFRRCPAVLTLNADTVLERLKACQKDEFFSLCYHHPRVLELIVYHNKVKQRLKILENFKISYASLNKIASTEKYFNRFIEVGSDRYHGMDKVYYLKKEFNKSKQEIASQLKKHPYWVFASLISIGDNFKYLTQQGFSKEEIFKEIILLLYPTDSLVNCLKELNTRKEVDVCRGSDGEIKRDLILPLVLYFIEKEYNFCGSGIWGKDGQLQPLNRAIQTS